MRTRGGVVAAFSAEERGEEKKAPDIRIPEINFFKYDDIKTSRVSQGENSIIAYGKTKDFNGFSKT
jgi:hypothetical protein